LHALLRAFLSRILRRFSPRMRAALSLSLSRKLSCGVVGEHIDVAMPALSMSSSDFCTDQLSRQSQGNRASRGTIPGNLCLEWFGVIS